MNNLHSSVAIHCAFVTTTNDRDDQKWTA